MRTASFAPHAPRDAGLSGLGLLMQITGRTLFWFGIFGLMVMFVVLRPSGWALLVLLLSVVRAHLHRLAGVTVALGQPGGVRGYLVFAIVQTAVVVWALRSMGTPTGGLVGAAILLGWWPLAVWALVRRAERIVPVDLDPERRLPADRGITGMSLVMVVLGVSGLVLWGVGLGWWIWLMSAKSAGAGMLWMVGIAVFAMALVRGLLHLKAARGLLRGFDTERFSRDRDRYFLAALLTSGLTMVLAVLTLGAGGLMAGTVCLPLMGVSLAWPVLVRDFGAVSVGDFDRELPSLAPPRDGGLGTLGVLLLAGGGLALASWLAGALGGALLPSFGAVRYMAPRSWITPGLVSIPAMLACGWGLLAGRPWRGAAAWLLLGVTAVIALWEGSAALRLLAQAPSAHFLPPQLILAGAAQLLIPLVLPLVVLWQLRRVEREPVPPPAESPPPETPRIDLAKG